MAPGLRAPNRKTKVTFFSSTFKVGESKVSLLFLFVAWKPRYGQFLPLTIDQTLDLSFKRRNGHISAPGPTNQKSKDTLLSPTLKVEEKKVSLVFRFGAQEPRYDHYFIFHVIPFDASL